MKIILLKDVKGVGKKFEEKNIADGYAANFLIPRKLAVSLSDASASAVKALKEQEEQSREKQSQTLIEHISQISGLTVTTKKKANEKGHLFEKITAEKISHLLKTEKGIEISLEHILLSEPIKEIGNYEVPISFGAGKKAKFTLEVAPLD